ncbi:sensor histidine kinase [Natronosalvus rutilus]
MSTSSRLRGEVIGRYAVMGLGLLYVLVGAGYFVTVVSEGTSLGSAFVVFSFIAGSGLVVFVGGYRLPKSSIDRRFYSSVARWSLLGIGGMLGILGIYHAQPDMALEDPQRSLAVLTALSCVAGFGIGTYAARAKTNALELERQNRALERVQDQLEETNEQFERSNERLEQFAYVASHDLQEPLRMVTSYLQLIESRYADELDEDGEEFIEYAVDGAERMRAMIDGLLEYSRVETQREPFEPVDLDDVFADVRKNLELKLRERDADLEVDDLPRVEGDPSQLRQLFQNLVSNAIEYSGDEPPIIDVTAERDGERWVVSVRDEGVGIDPDETERIFDIFQRLHSEDEVSGTGIGLAVCKRIAERHDGDIRVESEPGEGSTFSVTLPAVGGDA